MIPDLDQVTDRAWPGLEYVDVDGWQVRLADGVTRRANSVLPIGQPTDTRAAIGAVERVYAERGLRATFQISPDSRPGNLDQILARRGYAADSPTVVYTADAHTVIEALGERAAAALRGCHIDIAAEPDPDWIDLWWSVDGRGDGRARAIAHRILTAATARYVTLRTADGVAAIGRLAIVDPYGGLYALAVRPDLRGTGLGGALVYALAREAGPRPLFLQVLVDNDRARRLYERAGFSVASTYHYRVR
jgi:N-acetylglutamate synthase